MTHLLPMLSILMEILSHAKAKRVRKRKKEKRKKGLRISN